MVRVGHTTLMCRRHWFMVPPLVRRAVWAAWNEGGGEEWLAAKHAAVAWVAAQEAERR